ncbi:MAG: hypothetical protein KIT09_11425 [Bryobacteraceae bacterium]|nr:hypothetical protein [Bryobacteraceae bacterium]
MALIWALQNAKKSAPDFRTRAKLDSQLVQITDLLHELILDLLHPVAADHASDPGDVRVDPRGLGEESLDVDLLVDLLLQRPFS